TNARSETAAEKPSFRAAFKQRRCLIPVSGFYEWKREAKQKQPFYFYPREGELFSFAGLWECWHDPEGEEIQGLRSTDRPYSSRPVDLVKGRTIRFSRNLSLPGGERWPTLPSFLSNPTCRYPSSLPNSRTHGEPTAACTAYKTSSSSPCARSSPEPR